ncbi:MAG: hypothetical protein L6420_05230 [Elusimicrobia bacterium]|nr:hypothetical protein [Elusimicrobiota bacterium]
MKRILFLFLVFLFANSVLQAVEFEVVDKFSVNNYSEFRGSAAVVTDDLTSSAILWVSTYGATSPNLYVSTNGKVGIGTAAPEFKLSIDNDGGIIAKGVETSGSVLTAAGNGTRLIWYPRKSAFRVGYVYTDDWDDTNIGARSVGMISGRASAIESFAVGYRSTASGNNSIAMGNRVAAGAQESIVLGRGADDINSLSNGITRSLMVGFFSDIPTLFVGPSTGVGTIGRVGIGTSSPQAELHVSSAAGVSSDLLIISTGASNVIRMTGAGEIYANKFYGDGSGITGLPGADNLGNHMATTTLQMVNFGINTSSDITAARYQINGSTVVAILPGTGSLGIGINAGRVSTGSYNSFVGYDAGQANIYGEGNSFMGYQAGYSNTYGYGNSFMGYRAGQYNTGGFSNSFMGYQAGNFNTYGYGNSFMGAFAGKFNTEGWGNSFMGDSAGITNTTGWGNSFMGHSAGYSNTTGWGNSFMGINAGDSNTYGFGNSFMGAYAGDANTYGNSNSFMGAYAGQANTTGNNNSFMGIYAGYSNTTGSNNSFMGYDAGDSNTTGSKNSIMGMNAGFYNQTGSANAIFGNEAGHGVDSNSFSSSTIMGYQAGYGISTGSDNLLLGFQSGDSLTTGSRNIIIGYDEDAPTATTNDHLNIGGLIYGDLSAGKIGIGTTDPGYTKLKVKGDSGIGLENADDFTWYLFPTITGADNKFNIYGNSVERLTIDDTGNVGIGTADPGYKLEVSSGAGEAGTILAVSTGTSIMIELQGDGDIIAKRFIGDGSGITGLPGADNLGNHVATTTLNMATFNIVGVSTITVSSITTTAAGITFSTNVYFTNGNVGIGTGYPDSGAKLHVEGGDIWAFNDGNNPRFLFGDDPSTEYGQIQWDSILNVFKIGTDDYNDVLFVGDGKVGINANNPIVNTLSVNGNMSVGANYAGDAAPTDGLLVEGNVGIGTAVPVYKLEVSSGAGEAGTILAVSTGTSIMIELQGDGDIIAKRFIGDGSNLTGLNKVLMSFNLYLPDAAMDGIAIQLPKAATITRVTMKCNGGTNVIGRLYEVDGDGDPLDKVGIETVDWTVTTTETEDTAFNNAALDAGDYLWWETTSVSGGVTMFTVTVEGTEQ